MLSNSRQNIAILPLHQYICTLQAGMRHNGLGNYSIFSYMHIIYIYIVLQNIQFQNKTVINSFKLYNT